MAGRGGVSKTPPRPSRHSGCGGGRRPNSKLSAEIQPEACGFGLRRGNNRQTADLLPVIREKDSQFDVFIRVKNFLGGGVRFPRRLGDVGERKTIIGSIEPQREQSRGRALPQSKLASLLFCFVFCSPPQFRAANPPQVVYVLPGLRSSFFLLPLELLRGTRRPADTMAAPTSATPQPSASVAQRRSCRPARGPV